MKSGKSNESRKYKHPPEVRKLWREHYYKYIKPKRDAAKRQKEGSKDER